LRDSCSRLFAELVSCRSTIARATEAGSGSGSAATEESGSGPSDPKPRRPPPRPLRRRPEPVPALEPTPGLASGPEPPPGPVPDPGLVSGPEPVPEREAAPTPTPWPSAKSAVSLEAVNSLQFRCVFRISFRGLDADSKLFLDEAFQFGSQFRVVAQEPA